MSRPKVARSIGRDFRELAGIGRDPAGDDFIGLHARWIKRVGARPVASVAIIPVVVDIFDRVGLVEQF